MTRRPGAQTRRDGDCGAFWPYETYLYPLAVQGYNGNVMDDRPVTISGASSIAPPESSSTPTFGLFLFFGLADVSEIDSQKFKKVHVSRSRQPLSSGQ